MLCFPNAKINIGLNIIERRPDNFHNIETVFYPIPLSDILEIIEKDKISDRKADLSVTGKEIPGDPDSNLSIKAYHLLDADFDLPPVSIYLHKIIPMGAGLGGGSSDGAFTLTLLNRMFDLKLNIAQLTAYAEKLGSDCAFFIENKLALGTGKGNILEKLLLNLSDYYLVLVQPQVFVGTAEAYAGIIPRKPSDQISKLIGLPLNDWNNRIKNDFEESVFQKHPEIKYVKDQLYQRGAVFASMTGSGSAVYGIFEVEVNLKNLFNGMFYWGGRL
ncbi:MAG TPA: 4-(cytidine 5'-diphospho)-2-C-methyl-D-erythritol kinase, partial [Bacteroidales bacterium]